MTNEERIEERLIHAYERGYYNKVMDKVRNITITIPKSDQYKIYDMVCEECKQEWLKNTNEDGINYNTPN